MAHRHHRLDRSREVDDGRPRRRRDRSDGGELRLADVPLSGLIQMSGPPSRSRSSCNVGSVGTCCPVSPSSSSAAAGAASLTSSHASNRVKKGPCRRSGTALLFAVVECVCSDIDLHRSRVEGRRREIPGWYELTWERVERARQLYEPLSEPKVVVDAVNPPEQNLDLVMRHLAGVGSGRASGP